MTDLLTCVSGSKRRKTINNSFRDSTRKSSDNPSHYVLDTLKTFFRPNTLDHKTIELLEEPSYATPGATKSLTRQLKDIQKIQASTPQHELGWYLDPNLISNVFQWIVELHTFEPDLPLARDMQARSVTSVVLEMRFGKDYPMSPPFVRVIRPRFLPFIQGGGGHVTAGGAMCMELLTNNGWSPASTIESVLLQVRVAISNLDPRPARLLLSTTRYGDYRIGEAMEAYIRACQIHGWEVPKGFNDFAQLGRR